MQDLFDLAGRVALVTGATGGLGAATVEALAAHGATVILSDRDAQACEALASTLHQRGRPVHAIAADLADPASVASLADRALDRCGRVDILVCNAGLQGPAGPTGSATDAQWSLVMDVNLRSAERLAARIVPGMAQREGGSVILMSSIAGLRGNGAIGLYGLSKAALAQLARDLAVQWGPQGVRANAISPGLIRTPLAESLLGDDTFMRRRLAATPLRRVGEPHEIAGTVVFLASRAAGFVNGHNLVVDGGTTISDGS